MTVEEKRQALDEHCEGLWCDDCPLKHTDCEWEDGTEEKVDAMYKLISEPVEEEEEPKEEFEACCECVHETKLECEEPCCNCKHGIPYGDPRQATAPSYFVPEKEVAALNEQHDPVNHPSHYTNGGIECIDEMVMVFGEMTVANFCLCNVWKYRKRALYKNGEEDLKKADWYMAKYKELIEHGRN